MARSDTTTKADWPEDAVFTVGHSTLPIEQFIALLQAYGIQRLVDVRTVPRSRHNPQFNEDSLAQSLPAAGIEYFPMPALGGLRRARRDSPNAGWRNESFRGYADYMQTPEFSEALGSLMQMARGRRVAIICATPPAIPGMGGRWNGRPARRHLSTTSPLRPSSTTRMPGTT